MSTSKSLEGRLRPIKEKKYSWIRMTHPLKLLHTHESLSVGSTPYSEGKPNTVKAWSKLFTIAGNRSRKTEDELSSLTNGKKEKFILGPFIYIPQHDRHTINSEHREAQSCHKRSWSHIDMFKHSSTLDRMRHYLYQSQCHPSSLSYKTLLRIFLIISILRVSREAQSSLQQVVTMA